MSVPLPSGACCLGCGYALRGLPESVCPECGRVFDPGDPATFGTEADRARRRRRVKRMALAAAVLALLVVFAPRGIMTSTVTLTCPDCKVGYRTSRYELKPPEWMPASYPRIYVPLAEHEEQLHEHCPNHRYDVTVSVQSRIIISGTGSTTADPGDACEVCGVPAVPENGREMIEAMLRRNGVSLGCSPLAEDASP